MGGGSGIHFEKVLDRLGFAKEIKAKSILNARTASLDILVGSQGSDFVIHDDIMGSLIRRTVSNAEDVDIIIDLEQQKLLTIDHAKKTGTYV